MRGSLCKSPVKNQYPECIRNFTSSATRRWPIQLRIDKRPQWEFSQRRCKWLAKIWKMLNSRQWNANQNHNELSPHPSPNGWNQSAASSYCWQGCRERGSLAGCWWECELVQPLWKTARRRLRKPETDLPHEPAILLPDKYTDMPAPPSVQQQCSPQPN